MDELDRPYRAAPLADLRRLIEDIRSESALRDSPGARKLREEIDPEYSIEKRRDCCVYVIELADDIRSDKKFREKNPNASSERPCLYVGSTSRTPDERFGQHKAGKARASKRVYKFGIRLRPEFFEALPFMTRSEAEARERTLAEILRREGYGVWQG